MTRLALTAALSLLLVTVLPAVPATAGQEFYVAVAPYITTTHPCTYHVKGSCQAELKNTTLRFWLRSTDGTVNRAGLARTGADGFIEWWLPANKTYVVTFAFGSLRGTDTISTFPKDRTCITTTQLKPVN
ncbi:MAG: CueP family metal-binding protein [Armatimonadota bacterium]|nr:CueP family metal-binding protein [Armatimonadota bacterium]MDR7450562.1 CueP family metal-binding protein [Armatimonadota bacterium]MDR7466305.1 CueP family metal-binding protein [Armatimonadota bacterium]MDR7493026.1 CueP family metal-binding protein [Armatimonadota bacterium]MDR7498217.1 CueP family metal-binding protein [Armatimonadota bacterium]